MFRLITFSGLCIESDTAEIPPAATQRRRRALLALLALAGDRGVTRDRLIGYLWPESTQEKARHALEQLLYATRRDLGKDAILSISGTLRLNPELVRADVLAFEAACAAGEWEAAVAAYGGPFLDGFYLDDAPEFERWMEAERGRLHQQYLGVLERLASDAGTRGDYRTAAIWWGRLAAQDPLDSQFASGLISALAAAGDRAGALRQARVHEELVRQELGLEPDPSVLALVDGLRQTPPAPAQIETVLLPPAASASRPISPPAPPSPIATAHRPRSRFRWRLVLAGSAALVGLVVLAGSARAVRQGEESPVPAAAPLSVAVLPFVDMSPERNQEYFSDGMTEELIHALSRIDGLRVPARTSSFAFKGKNLDVRVVGTALGVRSVLEGSVRQSGDRLRVTVQLIDARTGYHLWSQSYDRAIADVFAVQDDIARSIVDALRPTLAGNVAASGAPTPTQHIRAYHLYLQGRYFWNTRTEDGLQRAVELFRQATEVDPHYAPAFSGLSDAYTTLATSKAARETQDEMFRQAEDAARTALRLDPTLAEAHASLGYLRLFRWDWAGAEREFRQAIELNPSYAKTYQSFGTLLAFQGRFDEGISMMHRARELDPLSLNIHDSFSYVLYLARRYTEAEQYARTLIAMDSTRVSPHFRLGLVLIGRGAYDEAIDALQAVLRHGGERHIRAVPALGYAYARTGRRADAERVSRIVAQGLPDNAYSAYFAMALFGALGESDRAVALLQQLIDEQHSCLVDVAVDPMLDPLRSDPRFASLVTRTALRRTGLR